MDGSFVPAGYDQLSPFALNWFENIASVQFNHRVLEMTTAGAVTFGPTARMTPPLNPKDKPIFKMLK